MKNNKYRFCLLITFIILIQTLFLYNFITSISYSDFVSTINIWFSNIFDWYFTLLFFINFFIFYQIFNKKNKKVILYLKIFMIYVSYFILFNLFFTELKYNISFFNFNKFTILEITTLLYMTYFNIDWNWIEKNKVNISKKEFIKLNFIFSLGPILFLFYKIFYSLLFKESFKQNWNLVYTENIYLNIIIFLVLFLVINIFCFIFLMYIKKIEGEHKEIQEYDNKYIKLSKKIPYVTAILLIPFLIIINFTLWEFTHIRNFDINKFNSYRISQIFISLETICLIIIVLIYSYNYKNNYMSNKNINLYIVFAILFTNIFGLISLVLLLKSNKIERDKVYNEFHL